MSPRPNRDFLITSICDCDFRRDYNHGALGSPNSDASVYGRDLKSTLFTTPVSDNTRPPRESGSLSLVVVQVEESGDMSGQRLTVTALYDPLDRVH